MGDVLSQTLYNAVLRVKLQPFVEKVFHTLTPGVPYVHNWHVDAICAYLEACYYGEIKRLIINVPPRSLKSICASVALPAWILGKDPTKRVVVASYSNELMVKHSNDCRMVMENYWYRAAFPSTYLSPFKNTQTEFATTKGGYRLGASVGGTLTGRGGNFIIIDDPLKPEEALSNSARARVNQWYGNTLYSRLDNKEEDVIILVMQRLHRDDLTGLLMEQGGWEYLKIPAIAEESRHFHTRYPFSKKDAHHMREGEVLHPARESRATLDVLKREVGSYNFASQYLQQPVEPEGNVIKWEWFQRYTELPHVAPQQIIQSWDTASKVRDASDYSVCTTWHIYADGYYLVEVLREKWEFLELKKQVIAQATAHQPQMILMEDKGSGTQLIQTLKKETKLPIVPVVPKLEKLVRVYNQAPKMEAGKVFLPSKAAWLGEFATEVQAFPYARHDDQVDSMAQALEHGMRALREVEPRVRSL